MNTIKKFTDSFKKGEESESLFVKICKNNSIKAVKTPKMVDMLDHIDYCIYFKDGSNTTVDVKSEKKKYRHSPETDKKVVWLETKNVNGNNGWLYGKATFIVFQYNGEKFIFVSRTDLVKLLNEKRTKWNDGRIKKGRDFYETYTRDDRKDEIIMFPISDILNLKHKILK